MIGKQTILLMAILATTGGAIAGTRGEDKRPIVANRCTQCGYLELYAP